MTEEVGRALRDGPADAKPDAEEVEGQRREAQDFAEGGGATGVAADVGGAASGGGTAVVEGVGAVDVAGTITGFSADIRACSSIDMEPASLLNPTSFPSSVLATDNEVCDDAGDCGLAYPSSPSQLKMEHSNSSEKPRPHPEPHQWATATAKDRQWGS